MNTSPEDLLNEAIGKAQHSEDSAVTKARWAQLAPMTVEELKVLVQKDKNSALNSDIVVRLLTLRSSDPAAYETCRDVMKKARVSMEGFKNATRQCEEQQKEEQNQTCATDDTNQTDFLLRLADSAELFHTSDGAAYADVFAEDGHRKTLAIEAKEFRRWLTQQYYSSRNRAPSPDAVSTAINTIVARACVDGEEKPIFIRIGASNGKTYIDLANDKWQAVEIDKDDWRVIDKPPVRFKRRAGMLAMPKPEKGGSVELLRHFLNIKSDDDFVLIVLWLVCAMRVHGPFSILVIGGEHGTAKSMTTRILRFLIDPNHASLRTLPREVRDLFIAANNGWVLAFDNLSFMPDWISDALCRLATGGGFSVRMNYTDDDEKLFDAMRPIILNGIENVAVRGDIVDRAIIMALNPIPENQRRTEEEILSEFEIQGLRNLPHVKLTNKPRMADFCLFAAACETAIWPAGTFMAAYEDNRNEANFEVIAASPLAIAICKFAATQSGRWTGTAENLLKKLKEQIDDETVLRDKKLWPCTGQVLSGRLRRITPALRKIGVIIDRDRDGQGNDRRNIIKISQSVGAENIATFSTPSTPEEPF